MDDHKYLLVEVDDLDLWIDSVARQMDCANDRFIHEGYEYGGHGWYFRGQSNSSWEIASSFERYIGPEYKGLADPERELRGKERKSIADFKALTWRQVTNPEMSNLEWLMLMQHYGVPTRLVDFTESASVAAYFAAKDSKEGPFAVWAVNKGCVQSAYQKTLVGREIPSAKSVFEKFGNQSKAVIEDLSVRDKDVVEFRRALANRKRCATTILIEANYNRELAERILSADLQKGFDSLAIGQILDLYPECPSERMVAQRGLFIMSEMLSIPFKNALMHSLGIEEGQQPVGCRLSELKDRSISIDSAHLIKYVFDIKCRIQMKMILNFANCLQSSLFPDMDGAARNVGEALRQSLHCDMRLSTPNGSPIYATCSAIPRNYNESGDHA